MTTEAHMETRKARLLHKAWLGLAVVLALTAPVLLGAQAPTLGFPKRIAESNGGSLVVSDPSLGGIAAVDQASLEILWVCPVPGEPLAVGTWNNLLFVGNATTHHVEVYRVAGPGKKIEFLYNLGAQEQATATFFQVPSDIAIDKQQRLVFVLDSASRQVNVFDVRGSFLYTISPSGEATLLSPTAIAVDETRQEVLVSDYGDPSGTFFGGARTAARILFYTYNGTYLGQIDGAHRFARPQGLAVDDVGRVYVAEALLGQIFVFNRSTGEIVNKLGSFGEAPGQLQLPLDVVLDQKSGDLFVTNNMLQRVEVFRGAGRLP